MEPVNCWEFMKCGHQQGGEKECGLGFVLQEEKLKQKKW